MFPELLPAKALQKQYDLLPIRKCKKKKTVTKYINNTVFLLHFRKDALKYALDRFHKCSLRLLKKVFIMHLLRNPEFLPLPFPSKKLISQNSENNFFLCWMIPALIFRLPNSIQNDRCSKTAVTGDIRLNLSWIVLKNDQKYFENIMAFTVQDF